MVRPDAELPASDIGDRYRLSRLLAVGGMAEIYLGRRLGPQGEAGKELVIKRLKPEFARDQRLVDMFHEEARISALLGHPNVVEIYDHGHDGDVPFIAMQYIRGEELNQLCRRGLSAGAFLPLEHAVELVRQAAMALGYVHALRDSEGIGHGIVHCDVSPNNLLVTEDGHLKLIDFGIAHSRSNRRRDEQAVPGKLSYMSPEQARREELDHRSDIFSLGVVLYEITLGRRLFKGPASEVVQRLMACDVQPPTFVRRDFPGMLESVVMRALESDPAERYASAYDMAEELDDFLRETGRRSGPLRVARYLDQLVVASGGERRPELVSEREETGDDDALDFDRGLFDGYASPQTESASRLAEWDEYEEDDAAIARALGVDVRLVRTAARAVEHRPIHDDDSPAEIEPVAADQGDPDVQQPVVAAAEPTPPQTPAATPGSAFDLHRADTQPPQSPARTNVAPLLFAAGLAVGVIAALLLGLLFG